MADDNQRRMSNQLADEVVLLINAENTTSGERTLVSPGLRDNFKSISRQRCTKLGQSSFSTLTSILPQCSISVNDPYPRIIHWDVSISSFFNLSMIFITTSHIQCLISECNPFFLLSQSLCICLLLCDTGPHHHNFSPAFRVVSLPLFLPQYIYIFS